MNEERTYALMVRAKHLPWLIGISIFCAVSIMIAGIYFGTRAQSQSDAGMVSYADKKVEEAGKQLKDQQLAYEKRLGEQSARYALEAGTFVTALRGLDKAIGDLQKQSARYARERQTALNAAVESARSAAAEASSAKERIAELSRQQQALAPKIDEAASAVKAVDKKLDTAVRPALPARPWIGGAR